MKGILYIITNDINDKVYIGKTYKSIEERFSRHKKIANIERHRKLYKAMIKYGFDHFKIDILGTFEEEILEQEEISYIQEFDSFNNGYNSTLGGDGRRYCSMSDNDILNSFKKTNSIIETATYFDIDRETVRKILHSNNIFPDIIRRNLDKIIISTTLNKTFQNTREAALYLIKENISSASLSATETGIRNVCSGRRNSYKNHIFLRK